MINALAPLLVPLWTTVFLLSGPHRWWQVPLWLVPMALPVWADWRNWRGPRACPVPDALATAVLGALVGLFLMDTWLLLEMARHWSWSLPTLADTLADLLAVKFLVGSNAALSGILVAHELIHRPTPLARGLGRLLLVLCGYEHFFTEHLCGHHRRVGYGDDPTTARLGESYRRFWWRSVAAQWRSAWRLESRRLRAQRRRLHHHRVLQGMAAEALLIVLIAAYYGPAALGAWLLQALMAARNLEAIHYLQHWGLARSPGTALAAGHAWHTDTWCSTHMILGLANHAHHHLQPGLPYQRLRPLVGSPRLPHGYFFLVFLITYRNDRFQTLALQELRRSWLQPQTNTHPASRYSPSASTAPNKA